MRIVKFEGPTMREALAKVKAELGDQAVVVSTRQIRRGLLGTAYEIAAAIDTDGDQVAAPPPIARPASPAPAAAAAGAPGPDVQTAIAPLRTELRSLRAMVRAASDGRSTTELRAELATLRKLVESLSARPGASATAAGPTPATPSPAAKADAGTRALTPRDTGLATPLTAPSTGRVVALVGPTGVGKTTTIAKIAARAALVDGRRVGVITVDNYRVGGVDQIRTFTDLIGIPLVVAEHPDQLADAVETLADRDLILIDTAGRSPRDTAAIAELAMGLQNLEAVEVHLTIAAATSAALIDDLHRRYRTLAPSRVLFTKLDEVDEAPELQLAPLRLGLPLTWLTTGQQVPEDLEEPTTVRVAELAAGAGSSIATASSAPSSGPNRTPTRPARGVRGYAAA